MSTESPTIYVIDDDSSIRRALGRVMTSAGLAWESFESADSFLGKQDLAENGCIVADMTLIGMSGLELQIELNARQSHLPLIFLTANDTEDVRIAAHHAGAAGYFRKPVDNRALLDAIDWALHQPAAPEDADNPYPKFPSRDHAEPPREQTQTKTQNHRSYPLP